MEEDNEYLKLSIEDRCVHKLWKARVNGYEEVAKVFRQIDDEKSSEWNKYIPLVKKFPIDTNAPAQEKGLEAVLAFLENCGSAGKIVGDLMTGIAQKCVAASKTKTKEMALQISLMCIEIEKQEVVVDELIKGTESKNPKIVSSCTSVLTEAVRVFGSKVINVNKILKRAIILLDDRDSNVRTEARLLLVEIYRWIGASLRPLLAPIKQVQLAELETEFEKIKEDRPKPTRLLRSQQAKKNAASEEQRIDSGDIGEETEDGGSCETDPYDLLDPVDILGKLPKDFYIQLEAKKWLDRKEALESLEKTLVTAPKLENGDYGDLIRALKKTIVKDSNVAVIAIAIKCVTGLANGLKKKFHPYAGILVASLLEKFKEKKQNVVVPLREAVDAIYPSTSLELMLEDILAALDNKNPSVKAETVSFLARCFLKCTPTILSKKLLKALTPALLVTLSSSDPTVRENAVAALGTAMKVVGEKGIGPYLSDLDSLKMAKVKEYCEKVQLIVKQPKKMPPSSQPPSVNISPIKSNIQKQNPADKMKSDATKKKRITPTISIGENTTLLKKLSYTTLSQEDAMTRAAKILPPDLVAGISSEDPVLLSGSLNQIKQLTDRMELEEDCAPIILTILTRNLITNVGERSLALTVDIIKRVGSSLVVPLGTIDTILTSLVQCMVNIPKSQEMIAETISLLSDATNMDYVSSTILNHGFDKNDHKFLAEALNWISNEVLKKGISDNAEFLMDAGRKALSQSNPSVRNAGLALIGTVHLQVGECESQSARKTVTALNPQRRLSEKLRLRDNERELLIPDEVKHEEGLQEIDNEENVTRIDVSSQITDGLIAELTDKNWKVRGEAVNKLQAIINTARNITPNLGDAPKALASRINDSNTKIAASAIALVEMLATAIGPQCKQLTKVFLPALLRAIGDSKSWIRAAVVTCLNLWSSTGGYKEFFEGEMFADALKSGTSNVRTELWPWLAENLPKCKSVPKDELLPCLPILYSNLEDRCAEVRKGASDAVYGFMLHLGFAIMMNAVDNMKGGGTMPIKTILEKNRCLIPEKVPVKSKPLSANDKVVRPMKLTTGSSATFTKSAKSKANPKAVVPRKKEEEVDTSPLLQVNNLKHQRVIDEQKMKTLKWNFTSPRPEFVELLRDQMIAANVNKSLIANMFHIDFKYHLRAIDALTEDLSCNRIALMSNLDLILRWMTIRFFDTNPSVLLKGLEYLNAVITVLIQEEYSMLDNEAASFFPYLILKVGDPKDTVRNSVKGLFKQISAVYPVGKQFSYVMDGLKSKNARQRSECLEQLGWLIESYGVSVCHPSPLGALKEIAKHIADRDTSVRNAALNCVVTAYFLDGEKILKMVGQISEKDMTLLEERIKRAAKNRPVASVKPLQSNVTSNNLVSPEQSSSQFQVSEPGLEEEENDVCLENPQYIPTQTISTVTSSLRLSSLQVGNIGDLDSSTTSSTPSNHSIGSLSPGGSVLTSGFSSHDPSDTQDLSSHGPYGLDQKVLDEIECTRAQFQAPKLHDVDLQFLKDSNIQSAVNPIQLPKLTTSLSKYNQPAAIKWELSQIANVDLEKAMSAMTQIDTILNSDKRNNLLMFVDYMVNQLVQQLVILNRSTHPDLVNCYRANFSLLMKLSKFHELCQHITEPTLYKVLDQLLKLLTEHRFETMDKHEMFIKVVNCLIIHLLESTNKTNIFCALIRILYNTVNNPNASNHFRELVVKCIWKLNRSQAEWDSELNYVRLLTEIHLFLKDYPTVWWKHQEADVPLRTVKTVLHAMVKIRGSEVKDHLQNVPGMDAETELYRYVKKVIKHLKVDPGSILAKEHDSGQNPSCAPVRLSKETHDELSEIFKMIGDVDGTEEGIRRLFAFKKAFPEADVDPFLSKSTVVFQQYIKRGLAALEVQSEVSDFVKKPSVIKEPSAGKPNQTVSGIPSMCSAETEGEISARNKVLTKEAEHVWIRLQHLQEQAGCLEEEKLDKMQENVKEQVSNVYNEDHKAEQDEATLSEFKSIKERLAFFKNTYSNT